MWANNQRKIAEQFLLCKNISIFMPINLKISLSKIDKPLAAMLSALFHLLFGILFTFHLQ